MRGVVGIGVTLLVWIGIGGCGETEPADVEAGGGQATVELFGRDVLSTELPEFATAFSASGDTVFFNRTPADRSRIDLMVAVRSDGGWSEAESFGPLTGIRAIDPFVSPDGAFLYFTSDLPRPGGLERSLDLWRLSLREPGSAPQALPAPINTDSTEVFSSIARDGTMVFGSYREGEGQVYEVRLDTAAPTAPVALELGGEASASNPAIDPDGELLVFARVGESGTSDLFVACREGEGWSVPVRLPEPINTPFTEFAPGFGRDHLYFTSERPGVVPGVPEGERPPGDLYRTPLGPLRQICGSRADAP